MASIPVNSSHREKLKNTLEIQFHQGGSREIRFHFLKPFLGGHRVYAGDPQCSCRAPAESGEYPKALGQFQPSSIDIGSLKPKMVGVDRKVGGHYTLDLTRPVFRGLSELLGVSRSGKLYRTPT